MVPRRASLPLAALLLAAGLTACAPTPAPSPTPTGFASEEEAFAAAEETYRAHLDSFNAFVAGDNDDYSPDRFLSGQPLDDERALIDGLAARSLHVDGKIVITALEPISAASVAHAWTVVLHGCFDYTGTRIIDANGTDVTPDRAEHVPLEITLATTERTQLKIVKSTTREDPSCR